MTFSSGSHTVAGAIFRTWLQELSKVAPAAKCQRLGFEAAKQHATLHGPSNSVQSCWTRWFYVEV